MSSARSSPRRQEGGMSTTMFGRLSKRAPDQATTRTRSFEVLGLLTSILLLTFPIRLLAQANVSAGQPWALVGGTVYVSPTEAPIKDGVILIRSGAIAAVGRRGSV